MIDISYYVRQLSEAYLDIKEKLLQSFIGDDSPEEWKDRIQFIKYPSLEDEEYMFVDGRRVCIIVQEFKGNKYTVKVVK